MGWHHGSFLGQHDHIVSYQNVLLHRDSGERLKCLMEKSFANGLPKFFPDRYFCMIEEYMDSGTVQHLMDEGLLHIEGVAAVTRQVSSALCHIHENRCTHNDVKPENVLLQTMPGCSGGRCLRAKLA